MTRSIPKSGWNAAYSLASFWILRIPALWYAEKAILLGIRPVLAAAWEYALAALLMGMLVNMVPLEESPQ